MVGRCAVRGRVDTGCLVRRLGGFLFADGVMGLALDWSDGAGGHRRRKHYGQA